MQIGLRIFIFILLFLGIGLILYIQIISLDAAKKQGFRDGYKEACVDFYKGKTKMNLKEKEDGTKEWVWLENK